jgi:hypothetical protein
MAPTADPYRTLGLRRGASLDEVKRAYRRLVKANHPDAAGEAALPRFLAIQAAYDQIVGPDGGTASTGSPGSAGSPRAWQADADRADATRRAYGGRARRTRTSRPGTNGTGRPGAGAAGGPTDPPPGSARSTGPDPSGASPPGQDRPPRPPKKATLGSTSYDGAEAEPFEPDWGGASWYGTTSGTYWTLNPKEYADPRKHGPEYQARARRAAADAKAASPPGVVSDTAADPATSEASPPGAGAPTHTTGTWWAATDGGGPAADPDVPPQTAPGPDLDPDPGATRPAAAATSEPAASSAPRPDPVEWLETGSGSLVGRVGRAVVGWAPIALGIGWLVGELTGCGRFSATCDPAGAPITVVAQLAALLVLLLVPRLAGAAVVASVATLAAAIPGALLLASMGGAADTASSRAALGGLLVIGWSVGMVVGLVREVRRARPGDRPVS